MRPAMLLLQRTRFAIILLALTGCSIETSTRSVTEATLRRSTAILEDCSAKTEPKAIDVSPAECLSDYARKNGVPLEALTRDAYGQPLVLARSEKCAAVPFCGPYSTGENRADDCGRGDDLFLRSCRASW